MNENLNTMSDFNLAVRLRNVMEQMDSGQPFWVRSDSTDDLHSVGGPNRKMICIVGKQQVGEVAIWMRVVGLSFEGATVAYAWQETAISKRLDGCSEAQINEAQAWVVARYYERKAR